VGPTCRTTEIEKRHLSSKHLCTTSSGTPFFDAAHPNTAYPPQTNISLDKTSSGAHGGVCTSACPLTTMASPSLSATVYDSSLGISEYPQFAPPTTPNRSPYKDAGHRRSPTKLLRPTKAIPDYDEFQALLNSDITTAAEKELASRVVRAAEKLKEWCAEIEQWGWSGSFEASPQTPRGRGRLDGVFEEQRFSGSLSLTQVEDYEIRLDSIDDELTLLEVDELKEQILGIHIGRSRPSSSYSSQSYSKVMLYDDFQLFVTETLIHTLPNHAKLKQYLKAWSARLAVLAEIPSFLRGSYRFSTILNGAYHPLQYPLGPLAAPDELLAVRKRLTTAQHDLREKVGELGKQLDRMLDLLEESDDRLPESWIDKFEADETEYTDWSYEADKKLFHLSMLETALANNHDTSAFVPPGSSPPIIDTTIMSTPVEFIAAKLNLGHNTYNDCGVADEVEESNTLSDQPILSHRNGVASNAVLATTPLYSVGRDAAVVQVTRSNTLLDESIITHTNEVADDAYLTATTPPSEAKDIADILSIPTDALRKLDTLASATPMDHVLETNTETSAAQAEISIPPSESKDAAHPPERDIVPDMSRDPAMTLQKLDAPTPALDKDLVLSDMTEASATGNMGVNSIKATHPMPQHEDAASMFPGPAAALGKLEGSASVTTEKAAIKSDQFNILQRASLVESTDATRLSMASNNWPSNDYGAEDGNVDTESLGAADLSFLETDPADFTTVHHLTTSILRRASVTSIESFSRDRVGDQNDNLIRSTN
jgi:hypothetical protein